MLDIVWLQSPTFVIYTYILYYENRYTCIMYMYILYIYIIYQMIISMFIVYTFEFSGPKHAYIISGHAEQKQIITPDELFWSRCF